MLIYISLITKCLHRAKYFVFSIISQLFYVTLLVNSIFHLVPNMIVSMESILDQTQKFGGFR